MRILYITKSSPCTHLPSVSQLLHHLVGGEETEDSIRYSLSGDKKAAITQGQESSHYTPTLTHGGTASLPDRFGGLDLLTHLETQTSTCKGERVRDSGEERERVGESGEEWGRVGKKGESGGEWGRKGESGGEWGKGREWGRVGKNGERVGGEKGESVGFYGRKREIVVHVYIWTSLTQ